MRYEINNFLIDSDLDLPLKPFEEGKKYITTIHINRWNDPLCIDCEYDYYIEKGNNIVVFFYKNKILVNYEQLNVKLLIDKNNILYLCSALPTAILPIMTMGMATIFNIWGFSPIHAAGFSYNSKGYLITGESGSGKSSILSRIIENNEYSFLCDDLIPIKIQMTLDEKCSISSVGANGFMKQWKYNIENSSWLKTLPWTRIELNVDKYYTLYDVENKKEFSISRLFILKPCKKTSEVYIEEILNHDHKMRNILKSFYCKSYMFKHSSFAENIMNAICFARCVRMYNIYYNNDESKDVIIQNIIKNISSE